MIGHPRTFLAGLVGRGIGGSRSREIHEREAAALGMTLVYRTIDFDRLGCGDERLGETIHALVAMGFDGINVTHPFKQRVMDLLDRASDDAKALGAVNTVVFRDGALHGFNTDWAGFAASFKRGLLSAAVRDVALIGSGGAGSAVAYALLHLGAERLRVFDPDFDKAGEMAARMRAQFPNRSIIVAESAAAALTQAEGVVQTSPVGMASHPGLPFDPALLRADMWVADIVYFPIETDLLRAARALGCPTLTGDGMVIAQAADAFELITGTKPSVARMLLSS